MYTTRKHLSAQGLISEISKKLKNAKEEKTFNRKTNVSLLDCLMSCFAVFSQKWSSLLQYDTEKRDPNILANLKSLYGVTNPPSDTYMRERLDEVDPSSLRPAFKTVFSALQRGKALEQYLFLNNYYLTSIDGTGHFSSHKVHCENCCVKNHYDGSKTYYHQMLGAAIVHPDQQVVIPLCPEPIQMQDGNKKNDCERNASERLLKNIRREHPHLKMVVIEDALSANAPHIRLLKALSMRFIITAKGIYDALQERELEMYEYTDESGSQHKFRYINDIPVNASNTDLNVNYLCYTETSVKGKVKKFSWITDFPISPENAYDIMKGGRSRWKIENETFNTLKNQGYHFEHNFGHGNKNLCTVMSFLMLLAFLIDQAQLLCCPLYQAAKKSVRTFSKLWEELRVLLRHLELPNWEYYIAKIGKVPLEDSS
jgi:hypothetical protein